MGHRIVVLDTETTGLEVSQGHRIIEIGCVEIIDRALTGNHYHQYVHPKRDIDAGALEVHGISLDFLADKPTFDKIAEDFLLFVQGAELVIHNAPFDVGFLNAELRRYDRDFAGLEAICTVTDSLVMARGRHPGQRNSLDALCARYDVDNSGRSLHGALLDAEILADVYLRMTGGQVTLSLSSEDTQATVADIDALPVGGLRADRPSLRVIQASAEELRRHEDKLSQLDQSAGRALWREYDSA